MTASPLPHKGLFLGQRRAALYDRPRIPCNRPMAAPKFFFQLGSYIKQGFLWCMCWEWGFSLDLL